jgi:hypothetical protein
MSNVVAMAPKNDDAFSSVADMEDDLTAIQNFAFTIGLLSASSDLEEPYASVLNQIAQEITCRTRSLFSRYSDLWRLTHPDREKTQRESCPDDTKTTT